MILYPVHKAALALCILLPILAIAAVALRFYARKARRLPLLADDWSVLVSLLLTVVACILTFYAILADGLGLGPKELPPQKIVPVFKIFYAILLLLYLDFGVIKISFILFYMRIFVTPRFRLVCKVLMAMITGWTIAQFIIEALNSWNIPGFWNMKLLDYGVFNISMAILDLVFDIAILLLPWPVIYHLQLDNKKKYSLLALFWLGSICIIASSLRVYYTYEFLNISPESSEGWITYVSTSNSLWLAVEANMSIISACLPTLGGFFKSRVGSWSASARSMYLWKSDPEHQSSSSSNGLASARGKSMIPTRSQNKDWMPLQDASLSTAKAADISNVRGKSDGKDLKGILVEKTFASE